MTADESRRLKLARRAWQATAPTDEEVQRAVRRIRRGADAPRRSAARRLPALAAAALVLGGALAYAANGGYSALFEGGRPPPDRAQRSASGPSATTPAPTAQRSSVHGPVVAETPSVSPALEASPSPPAAAPTSDPAHASTANGVDARPVPGESNAPKRTDESSAAARRASSQADADSGWRQVGEALAAGDEARATRALKTLARDSDPETRAKAELGLARLAAGAGDCERARRLALGVARTPGLDEKLIERAHDVVLRCEGR